MAAVRPPRRTAAAGAAAADRQAPGGVAAADRRQAGDAARADRPAADHLPAGAGGPPVGGPWGPSRLPPGYGPPGFGPPGGGYYPPRAAPAPIARSWRRGGYLPPIDQSLVVGDYGRYHLRRPPFGYHWVQVGNQFMLVSSSTGLIFDVAPAF